MSLKQKLARDGVQIASHNTVEKALCQNETDRDLTYRVIERKYPHAGIGLMQNPFFVEKI